MIIGHFIVRVIESPASKKFLLNARGYCMSFLVRIKTLLELRLDATKHTSTIAGAEKREVSTKRAMAMTDNVAEAKLKNGHVEIERNATDHINSAMPELSKMGRIVLSPEYLESIKRINSAMPELSKMRQIVLSPEYLESIKRINSAMPELSKMRQIVLSPEYLESIKRINSAMPELSKMRQIVPSQKYLDSIKRINSAMPEFHKMGQIASSMKYLDLIKRVNFL